MKLPHSLRALLLVLFGSLSLIVSMEGQASSYLGIVGQNDPDHLICIFPAHFTDADGSISIQLAFNAAFYLVSDVNLISGSQRGYQVSTPGPVRQGSSTHFVTVTFPSGPVPLCLALASRRTDFSVGDSMVLALDHRHSYVMSDGHRIGLMTRSPESRALVGGSQRLTILSHHPEESALFRLGRPGSRLRIYSPVRFTPSEGISANLSSALQTLPVNRWPLYLDLCNALLAEPVPGVTGGTVPACVVC